MTSIEELPVPAEYVEASLRFKMIWFEYLDKEKEAKDEIIKMVKILEDEGYNRTKAIQKIVEDHKDLRGFSRATIYRELPNEMKNNYIAGVKQLSNTENVSNETFEKLQEKDENIVNITTSQYNTQDRQKTEETEEEEREEKSSSFVVDLPPPEPELQDPKITTFVGKLPKSVLRIAEKIELSPTKLDLIANPRLGEHPELQRTLVKEIAPLSIDETKLAVAQTIRDLETGAIQKIEGQNSYVMNYFAREKIPKKVDRVKHPIEYFEEIMKKIDELMTLLTGYKLSEEEIYYEPNHIDNTEKHRQDMINELDERQKKLLCDNAEVLNDALLSLMDLINGGSTTKL